MTLARRAFARRGGGLWLHRRAGRVRHRRSARVEVDARRRIADELLAAENLHAPFHDFAKRDFHTLDGVRAVIDRAAELLLRSDKRVGEIAGELGFTSEYYFSRFFRKHIGVPPLAFRKRLF